MMRLTTIGHWGAYPAKGEATSGYLLQTEQANILLDCGSGVLSQLQSYIGLEQLDAVVLSHYHADHIADLFCLQYATMILTQLGKRKSPLFIYAHTRQPDLFAKVEYDAYCIARSIAAGEEYRIGGVAFTFAWNVHTAPCLSMRISRGGKSIVYTADTAWSDDVVRLADMADLLLCESSLYDRQYGQIKGHLTAGEAGLLAEKAGAKQLLLTHLPHYGEHAQLVQEAKARYNGPVTITFPGDSHVV